MAWSPAGFFAEEKSKAMLHNGIMKLYRRFLRLPHDANLSDDQVLAQVGLPSPTELLRRARLRHLGTLYGCGQAAEWGMLFQDHSWRELVRDDLHWLWHQLRNSSSLQDPALHFPAWEYLLQYHRGHWRRLVTRGLKHAVQQRKNTTWIADFHRRVFHALQEHGTMAVEEATYETQFQDHKFYGCLKCQLRCANRAGEGAHFFKVHGVINPMRYLFGTTQCPICLKEYHTIANMQVHLRRSHACREQLHGARHRCAPVPGIGSSQCQEQRRRHDGLLPHLQAYGPRLPPGPRRPLDAECGDVITTILDQASMPQNLEQLEVGIRQAVGEMQISWTAFRDAFVLQYQFDRGDPD